MAVVLLPRSSRDDYDAVRRALGEQVTVGISPGHTPGQVIHGDAIVIGSGPPTIDQDCTGTVTRYASVADLVAACAPRSAATSRDAQDHPPPDEPSPPAGDEFDAMGRPELIQTAARRWPGRFKWVTLDNDALRETLRDLAKASDGG